MNADFNPRGGLTVDRDSLHASPEYARQVEAAKQLQERSVNADVEKAVELLTQFAKHEQNCIGDYWGKDCALLSIAVMTKALRDQEAENARLRAMIGVPDGVLPSDAPRAITRAEEWCQKFLDARDRAEKAEALLRECLPWAPGALQMPNSPHARITAHLGGEHE